MAKTIDQISILVENKAGSLVRISGILAQAGIDIRAMSLADTAEFGVLRLIVDRPEAAIELLREAACIVSVTKVLAVPIDDAPGSLHKVLSILADASLFIEYSYAFITRKTNTAYGILRVDNVEKAEEVLLAGGITPAAADELYQL